MVLVYTPKTGPRCRYIFRVFFTELLGVAYKLTMDKEEFGSYTGARFSYSPGALADELHITSSGLLSENGIREQTLSVFDWNGEKAFFATGRNSALPFDPFSASFYLISRYEEYLPHIRDSHDRFDAKESLAWKNGFLQKPVINRWALRVAALLSERFPDLEFNPSHYNYISTLDIDNAYAFREKGFMRTLGGYFKDLSTLDFENMRYRTQVLLGLKQDPYDTYEFQFAMQKKFNLKTIYFFLVGDYGVNDKNLPVESRRFQSLIKTVGDYAEVGVHPSYGSNKEPERLKAEVGRLARVLHREITASRQHFLKLSFPDTYRNLIDLDITDDHSMGFANEIGFRAGICSAFNFYDLDLELETRLRIHPFAVMDATLKYYMKVPPEKAIQAIQPLLDEVKAVGGTFISLWHNESLSNQKQWEGWLPVYEEMTKIAVT
ncbi:MAG: polysaccharide deacetylase family protein [Bacteroidia bacterium]